MFLGGIVMSPSGGTISRRKALMHGPFQVSCGSGWGPEVPKNPVGLWPFSRRGGRRSISVSLKGCCQEHCPVGRRWAGHPLRWTGRTSPKTTAPEGNSETASSHALSSCSGAPKDFCFCFTESDFFIPKLNSAVHFKAQTTK